MTPFPGFHSVNFPILLVSGSKSINIVNASTGYMQPLINQGIVTDVGQRVLHFQQMERGDGHYLYFTSDHYDDNNQRADELYCVPLKNDFFDRLRKAGRLPIPSIDALFQEIEENNRLSNFVKAMDKNKEYAAIKEKDE